MTDTACLDTQRARPVLPLHLASTVDLLGDGSIRIGALTLDASEARAILVRLAEVVGAAEHVGDWPAVRTMLDHTFAAATPTKVRMVADGTEGRGLLLVLSETRAMLRVSDFVTGALVRDGARARGYLLRWRPDPLFGAVAESTAIRVSVRWPAPLALT